MWPLYDNTILLRRQLSDHHDVDLFAFIFYINQHVVVIVAVNGHNDKVLYVRGNLNCIAALCSQGTATLVARTHAALTATSLAKLSARAAAPAGFCPRLHPRNTPGARRPS